MEDQHETAVTKERTKKVVVNEGITSREHEIDCQTVLKETVNKKEPREQKPRETNQWRK